LTTLGILILLDKTPDPPMSGDSSVSSAKPEMVYFRQIPDLTTA
jgi:hypothetical protein